MARMSGERPSMKRRETMLRLMWRSVHGETKFGWQTISSVSPEPSSRQSSASERISRGPGGGRFSPVEKNADSCGNAVAT